MKKIYNAKYRAKNREVMNAKQTKARRIYRSIVFDHYGNECAHCKFSDRRALQIDHVDNNGAEERRALGGQNFSGWRFYKYLIDSEFPTGYQTLCANCNIIKHLGEDF